VGPLSPPKWGKGGWYIKFGDIMNDHITQASRFNKGCGPQLVE
jgi:hypothetical protein